MREHGLPLTPRALAPGLVRLLIAGAAWLPTVSTTRGVEPGSVPPSKAVMNLPEGGFVPGVLMDVDRPGVFRWRAEPFAEPFLFRVEAVDSIQFPIPDAPPRPVGDAWVELNGGDVVHGTLVELTESAAVLDAAPLGRLHLKASSLRRITPWRKDDGLVYLGPNGLSGWRQSRAEGENGWREESGSLTTKTDGAEIRGDLKIPARAAIEWELSWKSKPNFLMALGVNEFEKSVRQAFRFEVWGDELVVLRESDTAADLRLVTRVGSGAGRLHLWTYLDQDRKRIVVVSADGQTLAEFTDVAHKPRPETGLLLQNKHGDLRLERLRVSHWNGAVPGPPRPETFSLARADGSTLYGPAVTFDGSSREFVLNNEDEDATRIPEQDVASLTFPSQADDPPGVVRATLQDGTRLSGALLKVENGDLLMNVPGIVESPRLPSANLRSLIVLHHDDEDLPKWSRGGRFETQGVRLDGWLTTGREQPGASCLVWQPVGSLTASPVRPGASGRIVYKEPPPSPSTAPVMPVPEPPAPPRGLLGFIAGFSSKESARPTDPRRFLHLRSGDAIPAEVSKIDERGVTFSSPLSKTTFVAREKIKAVELATEPKPAIRLSKTKRERLLTLPRVRKNDPPTHLVRSRNGDYLRGRVLAMDEKTLQVEVRLETKDIPRNRVARIIWLHPDELNETPKTTDKPAVPETSTRVQAVRGDGVRLTFAADRFEDATLSGQGEVLGPCQVRVAEIDRLLIGGAVDRETSGLAYQSWKLHNAPEPKEPKTDEGDDPDGRASGTESAMVGKPAPDFDLELLGGKRFRLSEARGKIVVLDFWATWCGPCLQAMPQVDRVAREFHDEGVQLVAVNLQEEPKEITAMLERHKLSMPVALDRDGVVADKYGATAIPQTVIVGRDGKVARLFIGGGPRFENQLRDALKSLPPETEPIKK